MQPPNVAFMPETLTLQRTQQDRAENISVLTGDNSNSPSQGPQIQTQDTAENISVLTGDNSNSPSQGPQIQTQTQDTAENTSVLTGDNSNSPSQRPQIQTHRHKTQRKTPQSLPVTTATALASIRRYRHTDTRQSRKHLSPYW